MGTDKALLRVSGRRMLDIVVEAAAEVGEPLIIGRSIAGQPVTMIPDLRPGRLGPLAGLETALTWALDRDVALVAVDQPFLRPATLKALLALPGDAVVPVAGDRMQVTCAVYRSPCLARVGSILDEDRRSLHQLVGEVSTHLVDEAAWRAWGEDGRSWFSVDTPERLDEGLARYPGLR